MDLNKVSRFLSLILRHHPEKIGITLDKHGWASVAELLAGMSKTYPIDMDILEKIVRTDNKQRYSFNGDKTLIRANQSRFPLLLMLNFSRKNLLHFYITGQEKNMFHPLMKTD